MFLLLFMFREMRDIKESKNTYLAQFLTEVSNGILTNLQVGKVSNFKPWIDNLNFGKTTCE